MIPRKARTRFLEVAFPDSAELVDDRRATQLAREQKGPLYLDVSHLPEGHLQAHLGPELEALRLCARLDPTRKPIPVTPAPVGLLGGLWTDTSHHTSIDGLWAAGGSASLYHGACARGGNLLLADLHGGAVAGRAAAEHLEDEVSTVGDDAANETLEAVQRAHEERIESGFGPAHHEVISALEEAARDLLGAQEYDLADTSAEVDDLERQLAAMPPEARAGEAGAARLFALENMLTIAKLVARSACFADAQESSGRVLAVVEDNDVRVATRLEHGGRVFGHDGSEETPT
jgi:succinate dehydrogenase/fumarate reductase flavoprotein subunit